MSILNKNNTLKCCYEFKEVIDFEEAEKKYGKLFIKNMKNKELLNDQALTSNCCNGSVRLIIFRGGNYPKCLKCNELCNTNQEILKENPKLLNYSKTQSGFPHYRRGGLLQLFRMRPWGWEDRGKVKAKYVPLPKEQWYEEKGYYAPNFNYIVKTKEVFTDCGRCKEIAHVGIENNQPFLFCPKCLTKIKE